MMTATPGWSQAPLRATPTRQSNNMATIEYFDPVRAAKAMDLPIVGLAS
jgi:hypothetical protein